MVIKKMQIKTTMRYHFTPIRTVAIIIMIFKKIIKVLTKMWRNWNPHTLLVGM